MSPSPIASVVSTNVPPSPTPAAAPSPATPATPPASEDVAAIKAQLEELKGQVQESQRTAQYWFEQAKGKKEPKEPAPEPEEDVLDTITSKGVKGFDSLAAKRGFIKREEVEQLINGKVSQVTKETELLTTYPDLKNKKSEFFQATAMHYGELRKRGVPEGEAMELAAEKTELQFMREGKVKTPGQKADEEKAQREADRRARAAAGAGERGNRAPVGGDEDDDTPTADEQMAIQRLAEALEIPLDKAAERYKARAKKGVNIAVKIGGNR